MLTSIPGISNTTAVLLLSTLGDIVVFVTQCLNAFVGVDLRHYELGQFTAADHLGQRGDSMARENFLPIIGQIASASRYHCHIADYYSQKKKSSQSRSSKKIAIAVPIN
ncbi:transposase [Limosilactobacillus fermentum]